MSTFCVSMLVAFLGSYASIKLLKPFAVKLQLVDVPNERKVHVGAVPLIGGISVYIGFILSLQVMNYANQFSLHYFVLASAGILLVGIADDKCDLSVRVRMFCQLMAASVMMFASGQKIDSLGNILLFGDIHLYWFATPFTYLAIVGAINAFNMVDGIDGLIGGLTFSSMFSLAVLFYANGDTAHTWVALALLMSLIPYLLFNLARADNPKRTKIFMGDAGSMFIGLTVVWLLAIGSQGENKAFQPVTALWVIAIPLMDMLSVMIRRIRKGTSPFKAGRDHLHHIFMRAKFSSRQTLSIITALSFVFSAIGIGMDLLNVPEWFMFISFIILFLVYNFVLIHIWRVLVVIRAFKLKFSKFKKEVDF
ncbi:UDP-N-acetylglucosamine--undecaprenyl-phosphate N-acetylglucosaminephosphotransferase [Agarivorans gilvus]|uniref:Undecaprenyl-phosphate alpha-N-acetylglucosaminyl 1-phosphate transferase n=1 Tax=Agarivorans gilvus TaxID=680279 RepID=A0ABQ1I0P1_9ALTE|nr:UDP-N-acetylglucosamine--undecaprenyl-phosphate N-acetylglucosaminephosphotransferase [Agarivorans gilvus]GGA98824.1 undecaprenyl-phosphate alpha-N-acetylglucosaminyl 1-phosphate transferase [Agarivorans gilvus]